LIVWPHLSAADTKAPPPREEPTRPRCAKSLTCGGHSAVGLRFQIQHEGVQPSPEEDSTCTSSHGCLVIDWAPQQKCRTPDVRNDLVDNNNRQKVGTRPFCRLESQSTYRNHWRSLGDSNPCFRRERAKVPTRSPEKTRKFAKSWGQKGPLAEARLRGDARGR